MIELNIEGQFSGHGKLAMVDVELQIREAM